MKVYSIVIEPVALQDIQQGIDYYDAQHIGLGEKFEAAVNKTSDLNREKSVLSGSL